MYLATCPPVRPRPRPRPRPGGVGAGGARYWMTAEGAEGLAGWLAGLLAGLLAD